MIIKYSPNYLSRRKKLLKNNPSLTDKVAKIIRSFSTNPNHPGLNLEKLQGIKIWSIRIDKKYRIFFTWLNKKTVFFLDIGHHDRYGRYS